MSDALIALLVVGPGVAIASAAAGYVAGLRRGRHEDRRLLMNWRTGPGARPTAADRERLRGRNNWVDGA